MGVKPGQTLGQYVIVGEIGKGGMASVFRASQPSLSRQVAIKVLPEFFAQDPAFHERFRQEAMAIARLRHPNVLTVFDSGESDGIAYIVMELVDGGTLAAMLGRPLPVDECLRLIAPIASALDYAHAHGMVHRDVKPANILLTTDGTPILSDFGLARMTAADSPDAVTRLTVVGAALGTPAYMAPEQVLNSDVGPPADVYALATTLYEMLTGRVPYKADTPVGLMMATLNDPLPLPRERNPALSEAVQDVLLKGLAKTPSDRYGSAGEMLRALSAADRSLPVEETPTLVPTAPTASVKTSSLFRTPLLVVIGLAVVVAVGATVLWSRTATPPAATFASPKDATPVASPAAIPAPVLPTTADAASATSRDGISSAPAPPTPSRGGRAVTSSAAPPSRDNAGPLPTHGKLLYSLATDAADVAAASQRSPEDRIVVKGSALELTAATDAGVFARVPVDGVGDFVAVLRYVPTSGQPTLTFRFHTTQSGQAHAVRLPTYLRLAPASAGARGGEPGLCCQSFDFFVAPQQPGSRSIFGGPQPLAVPSAAGEEQEVVVSATGPTMVVSSSGLEVARASDASLRGGGMSLGLGMPHGQTATLRLNTLDLYETAAMTAAAQAAPEVPAHGKILFSIGDHVTELAATPQQHAQDAVKANGKSLELTAGSDAGVVVPLPLNGLGDFVALVRLTAIERKPTFQLRFHRSNNSAHVVQLPAYQRLGPPATDTPQAVHACCLDLDVYRAPTSTGAPALFTGPQPRVVPVAPNERLSYAIVAKGPLIVIYANGQEIGRVSDSTEGPGGMTVQVLARGRGQVPATLRLDTFDVYEPAEGR